MEEKSFIPDTAEGAALDKMFNEWVRLAEDVAMARSDPAGEVKRQVFVQLEPLLAEAARLGLREECISAIIGSLMGWAKKNFDVFQEMSGRLLDAGVQIRLNAEQFAQFLGEEGEMDAGLGMVPAPEGSFAVREDPGWIRDMLVKSDLAKRAREEENRRLQMELESLRKEEAARETRALKAKLQASVLAEKPDPAFQAMLEERRILRAKLGVEDRLGAVSSQDEEEKMGHGVSHLSNIPGIPGRVKFTPPEDLVTGTSGVGRRGEPMPGVEDQEEGAPPADEDESKGAGHRAFPSFMLAPGCETHHHSEEIFW